jgi:hypothetical protein
MRRRSLLVNQRLLELRLVGLRQLRLADVGFGHLLVGLLLAGLEVELLGRRRLGYRTRGRNRRGRGLLLRCHRGDRLRYRLGLVGRGGRRGLHVLGLTLFSFGDQAFDFALGLTGLAGGLVVVGLLERLGRLRLDGSLYGRNERLFVESARLLGVHRVGLGRLRLRANVASRRECRILRLLGLRRSRRMRTLRTSRGLDLAGDLGEGRIVLGSCTTRRNRRR